LGAVASLPFTLPNGKRVDLSADLNALLTTAVTETQVLAPTLETSPGPCHTWLELRSAISTLELSVARLGIRFGYSLASGETGVVTGVSGSAQVDIGVLAMDFALYQCNSGGCSAVAATSADHRTAGAELSVEVDFGQISTGPSLVLNTALGKVIRKVMQKGLRSLTASPAIHRLGWSARVREFDPDSGTLIFDSGAQDRLAAGQLFEVYAVTPAVGICDVFKAVAQVKTVRVDALSSVAEVERILDPRGIKEGDLVTVQVR
jgi:hypothetical protein